VAVGPVDHLVNSPEEVLLPLARRNQAGVIAMKVFGHGKLKQRGPALRYALSLPGVSLAIVGMGEEAQIAENVHLAESLTPLSEAERDALLAEAKGLLVGDEPSDRSPVFWVYDTKTMAWKEGSEPELARY
jgi:aryl-alcohol dehydrogenase-like predicted oxidoreductase